MTTAARSSPRRQLVLGLLIAVASVAAPAGLAAGDGADGGGGHRRQRVPVLDRRATLSADYLAPGPPSGALSTPANGRTPPYPGQVIPGFSGMVDNGDGTFWAMPDNGFGTKANSPDFLLRLYRIRPSWETAEGGEGGIEVGRYISLRDPQRKIPSRSSTGQRPGDC